MHNTDNLKRTPLYAEHLKCGAKMVPFGGWDMPVQYSGILEEHAAVRERVGLFDISHMGEFLVSGSNAEALLNSLFSNDLRKVAVSQAQYTLLCNEAGGIVDDLIAYRIEPSAFLLIVNASNIDKDFTWINARGTNSMTLDNVSDKMAALALQGPAASKVLTEAAKIPHFGVMRLAVFGKQCWVARTGYTGEDGFEIVCDAADAPALWTGLLESGKAFGIKPCGLGARDTLRLEMCYPLHGNDITDETTPMEAGLGKFVSLDKGEFIGRHVLAEQKEKAISRKLIAFKMTGTSPPPRPHYAIYAGDRKVGETTSGAPSPTLGVGIGMGYVETVEAQVGKQIEIEIRGKKFGAAIEKKPILKKG